MNTLPQDASEGVWAPLIGTVAHYGVGRMA